MTLATATGTACTLADMNAIVLLSPEGCLSVDSPAAQPPRASISTGPLGIVFAQGSNIIAAVNETSPLRGIVGAGPARVQGDYAAPGCTEVDRTRLTGVELQRWSLNAETNPAAASSFIDRARWRDNPQISMYIAAEMSSFGARRAPKYGRAP